MDLTGLVLQTQTGEPPLGVLYAGYVALFSFATGLVWFIIRRGDKQNDAATAERLNTTQANTRAVEANTTALVQQTNILTEFRREQSDAVRDIKFKLDAIEKALPRKGD